MASLSGTTPQTTYPSLIKFNDNSAISASMRLLSDGAGGATPLYLSQTQLNIGGTGLINATLGAKGTGTTSATKSFRAENSSGTASVEFLDDGTLNFLIGGSGSFMSAQQVKTYKVKGSNLQHYIDMISGIAFYTQDGTLGSIYDDAFSGFTDGVSIGKTTAPNASSMLEIVSTTKGLLFPRMTTVQKNAIATPVAGLVIYDTTLNKLCVYTTAWQTITSV
jgi:hypothetical protein